ncbi:MFS transporter [Chloroflexota bacterium]
MSDQTLPVPEAEDKLDFARLAPILLIVLIDLLGLTIIIPLLPLYAASFGANALQIGLITTIYPAMQFLAAPLLGSLSDRYGRKPVLIVSQIGTFIGFIVLGFANSLLLIAISRAIDGISGANISAAQAALTDSTSEKNRTQGLGLLGAAFGLGFIIGPIIAFVSLAASGNNYTVPAFVAAGFSLISILLTTFMFKETLPAEQRGKTRVGHEQGITKRVLTAFRQPRLGILFVIMFFQQLVFFGFESLITLFTLNRLGMNASANTMLFVYVGILIVMVQGYFIGRWSRRFGERKLVFAGLMLLGIGLILTALTPTQPVPWYSQEAMVAEMSTTGETIQAAGGEGEAIANVAIALPDDSNTGWLGILWLLVAMIPASIGGGMLSPSINSMLTQSVPVAEVGQTLGISASMVSGANAISPLLGGILFQTFGSTAPFLLGGIALGGLALFAMQRIKPLPKETNIPQAAASIP